MRVAFIYGGYENLGIEYLSAALLKEGHETELIFDPRLFSDNYSQISVLAGIFAHEVRVLDAIKSSRADIFCFSVVTDDYVWAKRYAQAVKDTHREKPVVFGGIHPSTVPGRVLASGVVDYVVVGEGEYALCRLVSAIEGAGDPCEIPGVWVRREGELIRNEPAPLAKDLDTLPFPDKALFYDKLPYLTRDYRMTTSRGCLFSCSYCCNDFLRKLYPGQRPYRMRSVNNVITELKEAVAKYPVRRVQFFDDLFAPKKEWLREFASRYPKEIGLPYWCSVSPSTIDEESVQLLRETGCCEIQMGVQSLNEGLRREILMRRESNLEVTAAIDSIRSAGIKLVVDSISGIPGETESDILQTIAFYNDHRPSRISDYYLRYYPGTGILNYARESGVLTEEEVEELEEGKGSRSFALGGSGRKGATEKLRFFLRVFLHFSQEFTRFIIRRKLWKFFPSNPFIISAILRLFQVFTKNDINAERYMARYLHFILGKTRKP